MIELQVKRLIALLCVVGIFNLTALASSPAPKSIRIFPEVQGHWFLDGKLPFGCEVTYTHGGKRRTSGYLNGNLPWRDLICESDQAIFHGDEVLVDLYKVRQNNNTLVIRASLRDFPQVKSEFTLKIPPVEAIQVLLPENEKPRYEKVIEPFIRLEWANGATYTYEAGSTNSLVHTDSVQMFFNDSLIFGGRIKLPAFNGLDAHSFSLSVVWASKPWLNDTEVFPFIGREHEVWEFHTPSGLNAANQASAPKGMNGVEGFHGLPGSDAQEVKLSLQLNDDKSELRVKASNGIQTFERSFSLNEFSLEIIARGGNGGNGGRGGEGGPAPFDDPYKAGIGGKGGRGGRGGKGANVVIEASPEADAFIPCIIVENSDGLPGKPGAGGRGGVFSAGYGMPTLIELLFPSRNYDGDPGDE